MNASGAAKAAAPAAGGGSAAPAVGGGLTMEEVAKHTTNTDCWVVVAGQVLNVTKFLKEHPGGELAIMTFAGKDATEEFNMIHPPDVIGKYAPDAVIGVLGEGGGEGEGEVEAESEEDSDEDEEEPAAAAAAPAQDKGDKKANLQAWGEWREQIDDIPGVFLINVKSYFNAAWMLIIAMICETCRTIFTVKNFKITNDRVGLTRSAIFLIFFIVIHAVGNLHVFLGPDDFNGYGYFYVRLYWTGFGLPANIV